jgi:hypothetical protein
MIKVAKVRTQIYLTEEQHQRLSNLSNQRKAPIAQMVPQAVDEYLSKMSSGEKSNPLSKIIALGGSGSSRGSLRHDQEIYGSGDRN